MINGHDPVEFHQSVIPTDKIRKIDGQQECIPVGCVSSAAVAVCCGRGVCPGGVSVQGVPAREVSVQGVSTRGGGVCQTSFL